MSESPIESGKRSGQPCIRGMRITVKVNDVLKYLARDESPENPPLSFGGIVSFLKRKIRRGFPVKKWSSPSRRDRSRERACCGCAEGLGKQFSGYWEEDYLRQK
jgi:hypothetical protein